MANDLGLHIVTGIDGVQVLGILHEPTILFVPEPGLPAEQAYVLVEGEHRDPNNPNTPGTKKVRFVMNVAGAMSLLSVLQKLQKDQNFRMPQDVNVVAIPKGPMR